MNNQIIVEGILGLGVSIATGLMMYVFLFSTANACVEETHVETTENIIAITPSDNITNTLQTVKPGDTVVLQEGTYNEYVTTSVDGTSEHPITIKAEGNVIIQGEGDKGRLSQILHDHYVIEGLVFTNADKLLWLQESDYTLIRNNELHHAYGECVRIKYLSSNNTFENNNVHDCGVGSYVQKDGGKNGEGVYIGTAPEQVSKNPTSVVDESNNNEIKNNTFNTQGNECVDIKEGASGNMVVGNTCTGQKDKESGGMDSRGNGNTFAQNEIFGNLGAGIRFGGDENSDGINNNAINNTIHDNKGYAVKIMRLPQGEICGNEAVNNKAFSNNKTIKEVSCN